MDRKSFIKYINKFGFNTTRRFSGSHEIFKSNDYDFHFSVPIGKDIKKGIYWNFQSRIRGTYETL